MSVSSDTWAENRVRRRVSTVRTVPLMHLESQVPDFPLFLAWAMGHHCPCHEPMPIRSCAP